ncbi:MAG: hypothetical protein QOJ40_2123 [Verrucomicrobiota bacterium]
MKHSNTDILMTAALVLIMAVFIWSCSRSPTRIALPTTITTVAAGYPFALQVKNQMAGDAHLTTVIVEFDRQVGQFQVQQIYYGFASPKVNGRVFAVTVDNINHEAFAAMDAPTSPDIAPHMLSSRSTPLDLSKVANDISQILKVAKTNGLDEFCSLTSPEQGNVDVSLFNSETGPVWSIIGDGWDEKGPIADLAITVDERTGVVLSHTLQKAASRQ